MNTHIHVSVHTRTHTHTHIYINKESHRRLLQLFVTLELSLLVQFLGLELKIHSKK